MIIDNGELLSGNLCKNSLGQRGGSLMHIIFNELGKEIAADFYFNIQTVVNNWLVYNGHSIGMFFFDFVSNVFINLLKLLRKVVENLC